jgi:carbon-monoxide dehydrogenase medium subunit
VKPPKFDYHRPENLGEALDLLAAVDGATLLAGGQSLLPAMNARQSSPTALIDLNRIPELAGIRDEDHTLVVGAMTRQWDLENSSSAQAVCPLLTQAAQFVGHLPTRTRGTLGGSLAQADPLGELPTAALALDAELVIASDGGNATRTVPAAEFFQPAGRTVLGPADLLTEIRVRTAEAGDGSAFEEADVVRAAVSLHLDRDQVCRDARIALAGVSSGPARVRAAETLLLETTAAEGAWASVAEAVADALDPPDDEDAPAAYRRDLARELVRRGLTRTAEKARTSQET